MKKFYFVFPLVFFSYVLGAPPREIPENLLNDFTMNGEIAVETRYFNNSLKSKRANSFRTKIIDRLIEKAKRKERNYYGVTDDKLFELLDLYSGVIKGKKVGIIGSETPWYESIVLSYEASPITVEYRKIETDDIRLNLMTVEEYRKNPIQFDMIISISSIEHDGLGRYGDPIDPWGDLKAMASMKKMLKPGGFLFLAVPVGEDKLVWNAHRVYGPKRLSLLFEGWDLIESRGFDKNCYTKSIFQPVFVLSPSL